MLHTSQISLHPTLLLRSTLIVLDCKAEEVANSRITERANYLQRGRKGCWETDSDKVGQLQYSWPPFLLPLWLFFSSLWTAHKSVPVKGKTSSLERIFRGGFLWCKADGSAPTVSSEVNTLRVVPHWLFDETGLKSSKPGPLLPIKKYKQGLWRPLSMEDDSSN